MEKRINTEYDEKTGGPTVLKHQPRFLTIKEVKELLSDFTGRVVLYPREDSGMHSQTA